MDFLAAAAGVALIALVVDDIFTVLFRSGAESRLSGRLTRALWALLRRAGGRRRGVLALAGPLAVAIVIGSWTILLVAGWALIYLPHYPDAYVISEGTAVHSPLLGALRVSLETLTTLGSSTAVPKAGWLLILSPVEALIGFGLLSAAISWLLQIYPVLSRRRSLAYEIHLLADTERRLGIDVPRMQSTAASQLYAELASRLIAVERDLVKFPIAYYFAETDRRFALSTALPHLVELAERGAGSASPDEVRLRAAMLLEAIEDFAQTVADRFLPVSAPTTDETLRAFAHDHRHHAHAPAPEDVAARADDGADGASPAPSAPPRSRAR